MPLIVLYLLPTYIYSSSSGLINRFLDDGIYSLLLFLFSVIYFNRKIFKFNFSIFIGFILLFYLFFIALISYFNGNYFIFNINLKFILSSLFFLVLGMSINLKNKSFIYFLNFIIILFILCNYDFSKLRMDFSSALLLNHYQAYLEVSHYFVVLAILNLSILNIKFSFHSKIILLTSYVLLITCAGSREDFILGGVILLLSFFRNIKIYSWNYLLVGFFLIFIISNTDLSSTRFQGLLNLSDDHSFNGRIQIFLDAIEIIANNFIFGTFGAFESNLFMHNILFYLQLYGFLFFILTLVFIYKIYKKIFLFSKFHFFSNNSHYLCLFYLSIYFLLDAFFFSAVTLQNFFFLAGILFSFEYSITRQNGIK